MVPIFHPEEPQDSTRGISAEPWVCECVMWVRVHACVGKTPPPLNHQVSRGKTFIRFICFRSGGECIHKVNECIHKVSLTVWTFLVDSRTSTYVYLAVFLPGPVMNSVNGFTHVNKEASTFWLSSGHTVPKTIKVSTISRVSLEKRLSARRVALTVLFQRHLGFLNRRGKSSGAGTRRGKEKEWN